MASFQFFSSSLEVALFFLQLHVFDRPLNYSTFLAFLGQERYALGGAASITAEGSGLVAHLETAVRRVSLASISERSEIGIQVSNVDIS